MANCVIEDEIGLELSETSSHRDTLEVIFDDEQQAITRRRSSVVAEPLPLVLKSTDEGPSAECLVHSLLDGHRIGGAMKSESKLHQAVDMATLMRHDGMLHESSGQHNELPHRDSRVLSKKQLSDMAFGIRELSKNLAHMKLKLKVQNIFILGKAHDQTVVTDTRQLVLWLLESDKSHRVYVEDTLEFDQEFNAEDIFSQHPSHERRLRFWTNDMCHRAPQTFDIVIALGGDGTVLYASYLFQKIVPPVLSFALGSLGFLTKFDFNDYKRSLKTVFSEGFHCNLRLRFEATIMRKQKRKEEEKFDAHRDILEELIGREAQAVTHDPDGSHHILNEVVLDRGPNGTMITLEVFGDNDHFTTIQADGICVATPTGSTAYNLAAGGSLCHPDNPVVLLTAICAHTLSFRPIILPDTIVLRLAVPYDARTNAWASFDGKERVELFPGDYVTISASRFPFPSVLPLESGTENWIDSISRTLNWNSRQRQKAWRPVEESEVKE